MEYIEGVSLQERLDRGGPLEVKEILRIGLQIATGLAAAHAQGLVHRDIKPANILLENHVERVKITDFGLARARADASLTQEGVVAGTPQYMAPEQARGETLDHRADLFSLGSVLYALCTGLAPFRAENTLAVLKRVCEETPRPIREFNPDVPAWLVEIVARLQAKDPAERIQSAQEVADVLGRELAAMQRGGTERPPTPPARRSRRLRNSVAAVFILLAAVLILTESTGITRLAATVFRGIATTAPGPGKVDDANTATPPAPPKSDPLKPFVILTNAGQGEESFATLAEAVAGTRSGDTIEIRGDGPFACAWIDLEDRALVIRAGPGCTPVFEMVEKDDRSPHLDTRGPLVLEGLEFHRVRAPNGGVSSVIQSRFAPLWMTNCRFILKGNNSGSMLAFCATSPILQIRNCHLIVEGSSWWGIWDCDSGDEMTAEGNAVMGSGIGLNWSSESAFLAKRAVKDVVLRLRRNTICVQTSLIFSVHQLPEPFGGDSKQPAQPYRMEVSENLFGANRLLLMSQLQTGKKVSVVEADAVLRRLVDWRERCNVHDRVAMPWQGNTSDDMPKSRYSIRLSEWEQFWGLKDTGSSLGRIRFSSGFRLATGSAGKGAGEGGRDLGADVDLVGPGPAYERWKKTPAYQQWLKDSGQKN
jgi:hypothetical protein